jgi:hypothetical protein
MILQMWRVRVNTAKIRHQQEATTANRNADDSNGKTLGGTNRHETTDVSDRLHSYRQLHADRREWAFDDQHGRSVRSVRERQPATFFAADRKSVASRHSRSPSRRSIPAHHRQRQHSRALIDSLKSLTTPAEHPVEVGDKEDEMADTVTVICPDGCASGDTVTFVIDADNDQIELDVVIPAGVVARDEFEVQFDSSASYGVYLVDVKLQTVCFSILDNVRATSFVVRSYLNVAPCSPIRFRN